VVLLSHHGLDEMTNRRARPDGLGLVPADELRALVHRFPNVVAWVNGHTHTNGVQARRDPLDPGRGFWEITTCSVMDWPCQARLIELADDGHGTMSVVCTMLDHDGVIAEAGVGAAEGWSGPLLAGLHRELAANVPFAGPESPLAGSPADRNVVLRMRAPFPLGRAGVR
jgi:hypothetical protein